MSVNVIVSGLGGRMGSLIAQQAMSDERHLLLTGCVHEGTRRLFERSFGDDIEAALSEQDESALSGAVWIDFTHHSAVEKHLALAERFNLALLIGTTGLDEDARKSVQRSAKKIPLMLAANTSLGANLLFKLSAMTAEALPQADIEIIELHHRQKRDAPSGTALRLADHMVAARGGTSEIVTDGRHQKNEPRKKDEIGVFGARGGTVPGEHTSYFFLDDERIEIAHKVQDRKVFAHGALHAARFLSGRSPGLYTMLDALGLS